MVGVVANKYGLSFKYKILCPPPPITNPEPSYKLRMEPAAAVNFFRALCGQDSRSDRPHINALKYTSSKPNFPQAIHLELLLFS